MVHRFSTTYFQSLTLFGRKRGSERQREAKILSRDVQRVTLTHGTGFLVCIEQAPTTNLS